MTLDEHKEEVKKLKKIESKLIQLVANSNNDILMDKFLEWQTQRTICNEGFCKIILNSNP
jgi:hypothetical protein